jgi:hypothetical protein
MTQYEALLRNVQRILAQFGGEKPEPEDLKTGRRKHTPEQMRNLLQQIEAAVANGKTMIQACKEAAIMEQTYDHWRREHGAPQVDHAQRLKELEHENANLKRLLSDLSTKPPMLKDTPRETSKP